MTNGIGENGTNRLTGAEAMVRMLQAHDVRHIFGLCGDTTLPLYDALARLDHGITHILTRDERHAAYMADGYARMFRQAGFEQEVDELRARQAEKDRDGAVAAISERMIQAIDFIGSESEVTDFMRTYIDAGVEHPVLMPMPWGEDRRAVAEATMKAAAAAVNQS